MKPSLFAGSVLLSLAACSTSPDGPTSGTSGSNTDNTRSPFISGTWVVTSLTQGAEDLTTRLDGYTFTFLGTLGESGPLVASRAGAAYNGRWTHSAATTYYNSATVEEIVLNVGLDSPLDRLTGSWIVVSRTSSTLILVNPEVREGERVVFTKQ